MKTKLFVLATMLFSNPTFALADTQKVDAEHLQQHRDFEQKNLEQQRFKSELERRPIEFEVRKMTDFSILR